MDKNLLMMSFVICGCLLSLGCSSSVTRIEKAREVRVKEYQAKLKRLEQATPGGSYQADWEKAKADMLRRNPRIVRINHTLSDQAKNRLRVWTELIPSLSVSLSDSATLREVSELFEDSNFRVSSFFSFGNLLDLPVRLKVLKLRGIAAELSAEMVVRNQVIGLYRIFREKELLALEEQALKWEKNFFKETAEDELGLEYEIKLKEFDGKFEAFEKKKLSWVKKVNDMLMADYSFVELSRIGLPNIVYNPENLDFSDSDRWGSLQMNLLALELIAEEARLRSAYVRYLPDPNLGVTAPPLFSNTSNTDFKLSEFRVSPGVTWRLDTRNSIGEQIHRIKREKPIRDWTRDKRVDSEISKLLEGRDRLKEVQLELKDLKILRAEYLAAVKSGLLTDYQKILANLRSFKEKEISLKAREIEICTSFWLIDEKRWVETIKQWKRTTVKRKKK